MANDFLTNLRAARTGSKERAISSNMLPTRGDIQKERQAQSSVDPNSFLNFLRIALGGQRVPIEKERLDIRDVSPHNIDKMSPEDEELHLDRSHESNAAADNSMLKVEPNIDKYGAAARGTVDIPYAHSDFKNAYDILDNYDALNKVLDEYDAINTWSGKQKFLIDAYKRFDDKHGDIGKWFDRLYGFTIEAKYYNEPEPKQVTDAMRQLNKNIRTMMLRQS